jgi:hypothetical protein
VNICRSSGMDRAYSLIPHSVYGKFIALHSVVKKVLNGIDRTQQQCRNGQMLFAIISRFREFQITSGML